jgi:hypothetical protein
MTKRRVIAISLHPKARTTVSSTPTQILDMIDSIRQNYGIRYRFAIIIILAYDEHCVTIGGVIQIAIVKS